MNHLTQCLAEICQRQRLQEKWLLAPSMRVGHQWLDAMTRAGHFAVNVRVKTLKSVALALAAPRMAEQQLKLLSDWAGVLLVDRLFRRLRSGGLDYLGGLEPSLDLAETIYRSLESLRLAGMPPASVDPARFEVSAKGRAVRRILEEYLAQLAADKLVDYAGVLRMAASRLQAEPGAIDQEVLVLEPQDFYAATLERQVLDAIPRQRHQVLPVDEPAAVGDSTPVQTDRELLRWMAQPDHSPPPLCDQSVQVFRAVGEANEIREVLRRCLNEGIALDDVELLYTDAATYGPLIYEILWAALPEAAEPQQELPLTLAEGIACRYSRPGRLLAAWVAWIEDDFAQDRLLAMLREGLFAITTPDGAPVSFGRLAALLRSVGIGHGRGRYLPALDAELTALEQAISQPVESDEEHTPSDRKAARARRRQELQILRDWIERLLEISPDRDARPDRVLSAAGQLLESLGRRTDKLDNFARERLQLEIADLARWLPQAEEAISGDDLWQWLRNLPAEATVLGSGPQPGKLHAASVFAGGHSGRPYTFIVGLDDTRFPGAGSQDPLLLDAERRAMSTELPTAVSQMDQRMTAFYRLLARLRGRLTLSYPCRDLTDDRELFPSPVLVTAYRILSGQRDGTQHDFAQWLAAPASFAPADPSTAASDTEWWLSRLCATPQPAGAAAIVQQQFPHLARGAELLRSCADDAFTPYDGLVPQAGADLDPAATGTVFSSSALELLGRCGLAYFFARALEIRPPDELRMDPTCWLDPAVLGSLLHKVFERFFRNRIAANESPCVAQHAAELETLLQEEIDTQRAIYPVPNQNAYQAECRQMQQTCRILLAEEEQFCRQTGSRPAFLEVALGLPPGSMPSALDVAEPLRLLLPDGTVVRVRGKIDRIDRLDGEAVPTYTIWDYKTGSAWKYRDRDPFHQGRVVQPAIYVSMVAHELRRRFGDATRLASFGFFFPTPRERGRRISWTPEQLGEGLTVVQQLLQTIRQGAFPATDSADDCTYCDYRRICGNPESVAAASKRKLDNPSNQALLSISELRGRGEGTEAS
jgi:ATP-dependent helicase/nuclease subunit B